MKEDPYRCSSRLECHGMGGLEGRFEQILSTDRVHVYKPDPRLQAAKTEDPLILFASFRGWDAVGAKSFGYETYWANRLTD